MASPNYWFDRPVENLDEALRILAMRVTTHRGFINCNFPTTPSDQIFEFTANNTQERFRQLITVKVLIIRKQTSAQRVRSGNAHFERETARGQTLQAFEIVHRAKPARRG